MIRLTRCLLVTALLAPACSDDAKDPKPTGPADQPPTPFAVASPSVVFEGDEVTLDARGSTDDKGIATFQWIQVEGPDANIENDRGALTLFVAPNVTQVTYLRFELEVVDTLGYKKRFPFTVTVVDTNATPVADPGPQLQVAARSTVTLDGSDSSDNDGSIRTYRWQQVTETGGTNVSLTNASTATATFPAPDVVTPATLQFRLTVTDNDGSSSSATTLVRVNPAPAGLALGGMPTSILRNASFGEITVELRNAAGTKITGGDASDLEVTLAVSTGTGQLRGTVTRRAGRGVATFDDLHYDTAEDDVVLRAFLPSAPSVQTTATVDVTWPSSVPGALTTDNAAIVHASLVAPSGDLIIAGEFSGTTDFALGATTESRTAAGTSDGFVARYDGAGVLEWVFVVASASADSVTSVALDASENVLAGGVLGDTFNFGTSGAPIEPTHAGGEDGVLFELPAAGGTATWAVTLGAAGGQRVHAVARGGTTVYATGAFTGALDFDLGAGTAMETAASDDDGFVVAYDRAVLAGGGGTALQWYDSFGAAGDDTGRAIALATDSVYVGGSLADEGDAFVMRYARSNGELAWLRQWTPTDGIVATTITDVAATDAGPLVVGHFSASLDLDPTSGTRVVTSAGDLDVFVVGLEVNGSLRFAETFGGAGRDEGGSVAAAPSTTGLELVVSGSFRGTVDFAPGTASVTRSAGSESAGFVVALAAQSALRWVGVWQVTGAHVTAPVVRLGGATPSILVSAAAEGTLDLDPTADVVLADVDAGASFLVKLDEQGRVTQ